MGNSLTFTEVALVIFYRIKIALTFRAIFPNILWEIYSYFILQESLPLELRYLTIR